MSTALSRTLCACTCCVHQREDIVAFSLSLTRGACVCYCSLLTCRWMKSVASLSIAYTNVVGDSIVAAGTIAYLGAFTSEFRHMLVHDWLTTLRDTTVPHTDGTNVCSTLANPVEVRTRACLLFVAQSPPPPLLRLCHQCLPPTTSLRLVFRRLQAEFCGHSLSHSCRSLVD
jgi:hypothetical protein